MTAWISLPKNTSCKAIPTSPKRSLRNCWASSNKPSLHRCKPALHYGAKTENWSPEQRDLFEETIAADIAAIEAEMEKRKAQALPTDEGRKKAPRARGRQPLPAHLPRVDIHHDVNSYNCDECGKALVAIGEGLGGLTLISTC